MTPQQEVLQNFLEEKFYNIVHKRWMSLSEVEYLKIQQRNQQLVVLETPQTSIDQWLTVFRAARRQA